MINRIVKMTFIPTKVEEFLEIFYSSKERIRNAKGCQQLELLRDIHKPNVFFTHSRWISEEALNAYRNSELFRTVWGQTKLLFAAKAEAWSLSSAF